MRSASRLQSTALAHLPPRDRLVTIILVTALHILLLLLLLRLASADAPVERPMAPLVVDLLKGERAEPEQTRVAKAERAQTKAVQPPRQVIPPRPLPPQPQPQPPKAPSIWSQVVPLTREQLAATDAAIKASNRPARDTEEAGEAQVAATGRTDSSDGPGAGPHGETLYNARWYREPTNAELDSYLPPGRPREGWGIIACKTIPGNRVDDCHEIAQSPGSGLAGAVRRAAWQFRILPPRINGRPMIGEWVRIRIDYTVTVKSGP